MVVNQGQSTSIPADHGVGGPLTIVSGVNGTPTPPGTVPLMAVSAGILMYKIDTDGLLHVLIAHMGGPFWAKKDDHAWSIPKGEYGSDEDPKSAAAREFAEEMGSPLPEGVLVDLGVVKQSSAKSVTAYALLADFDADNITSNTFEMEWPPRSGRKQSFPESTGLRGSTSTPHARSW